MTTFGINILRAISLSYQTASLEWRQGLQLSKEEAISFMQSLKDRQLVEGILVITTCNRTEVYYESADTSPEVVQEALLQFKNIACKEAYESLFEQFTTSENTVRYLLETGLGLRSQVIGDRQIIGQFKESYRVSQEAKLAGPLIHQALQTLFRTHKRVHNETGFRSGAASIGYAALERIADFIPRKEYPYNRVLIIGTGRMGIDVAKYVTSFGFTDVTVTNRTDEKAIRLAEKMNLQALPYHEHLSRLTEFEVIIACVSGGQWLLPEQVGYTLSGRKRILIDLSVPTAIHPEAGQLPHTTLVNIDQLTSKTQEVRKARQESITQVINIIREESALFAQWLADWPVAKALGVLKAYFASVLESEMQKHPAFQQKEASKELAEAALNRLIRRPAGTLKSADAQARDQLLQSLSNLFRIPASAL